MCPPLSSFVLLARSHLQKSVFSVALDDDQLGNLTNLFPRSFHSVSDADIKMEGTFVFYKWLLTGISIPELKRMQKMREGASLDGGLQKEDDGEQRGKRNSRKRTNFNIQVFGNHLHNVLIEDEVLAQGMFRIYI